MPRHTEISLNKAIKDFFVKIEDEDFTWTNFDYFNDCCLECDGTGQKEHFDDDYFCPIYVCLVQGTLEYEYRPCQACNLTGSFLTSLLVENMSIAPESNFGILLKSALTKEH